MVFDEITEKNRSLVNAFLIEHWYSTTMIMRGKEYDLTCAEGVAAFDEGTIVGLITYMIYGNQCEITSLDSLRERQGIGTTLVNKVIEIAKDRNCGKIVLITTNDNINAIGFYQKRGFDLAHLYHNALDISRTLKPQIPLIGDNSIPLKHELEFIMLI